MTLINFAIEEYVCGATKCKWLHILVIHDDVNAKLPKYNKKNANWYNAELWHISLN